jgi:hypothetical protein
MIKGCMMARNRKNLNGDEIIQPDHCSLHVALLSTYVSGHPGLATRLIRVSVTHDERMCHG